jgi:hypothetical protein
VKISEATKRYDERVRAGLFDAAIHEAGHVVVAMDFGWPIAYVEVNSDATGLVWYKGSLPPLLPHQVARHAVAIDVDGLVAEALEYEILITGEWLTDEEKEHGQLLSEYLGERHFTTETAPCLVSVRLASGERGAPGSDLADAFRHAEQSAEGRRDPMEVIRCAEQQASEILKLNWDRAEKLADSLLRRKTCRMTYRQIVRLIRTRDFPQGRPD